MHVNILVILCYLLQQAAFAEDTTIPHLGKPKIFVGPEGYELSGFTWFNNKLLGVSDDSDHHFIYEIELDQKRLTYTMSEWLDLTKLKGYDLVSDHHEKANKLHPYAKKIRLDLEGIASCGKLIYLADERARLILEVDPDSRTIKVLPLNGFPDELWLGENAGLESVAIRCQNGLPKEIITAKEREPRFVAVFEPLKYTLKELWPKVLSTPGKASPSASLIPADDIADLSLDGDRLVVLERNARRISFLDNGELVQGPSYTKWEEDLYITDEPFGQAEAMLITDGQLLLGWDQNRHVLTKKMERLSGLKGCRGVILQFAASIPTKQGK